MIPRSYYVANSAMIPCSASDLDSDPRGIIWIFEEPDPRGVYVMGVDPSGGIPLWNRYARTDSDHRTDNGAIQILKVGRGEEIPDKQVCEFAAPIDPEDLGEVANIVGRVYGGSSEEGQAKAIIEIQPGPGLLTQRKLISYGYTNLFVWSYLDGATLTRTNTMGWTSTPRTQRDLWLRSSRHMIHGLCDLSSPWLIEEMADAEMNMAKMRAQSVYGKHDDRLMALMLAIWCAREWSLDVETVPSDLRTDAKPVDPQACDMTYSQMMDQWEEQFCALGEER
ncbi:MAG TPA: hypothetical protein VKQ11_00530 [Candidatus Sulfotelmatobacter sp.]|nr:hypothetical protein [Candidatus Sulfotelmatobacter sp.]